jgi:hypothetical protein
MLILRGGFEEIAAGAPPRGDHDFAIRTLFARK